MCRCVLLVVRSLLCVACCLVIVVIGLLVFPNTRVFVGVCCLLVGACWLLLFIVCRSVLCDVV